jgi:hypothetical protein
LKSVMVARAVLRVLAALPPSRGPRVRSGAMLQNQPWRRGAAHRGSWLTAKEIVQCPMPPLWCSPPSSQAHLCWSPRKEAAQMRAARVRAGTSASSANASPSARIGMKDTRRRLKSEHLQSTEQSERTRGEAGVTRPRAATTSPSNPKAWYTSDHGYASHGEYAAN